MQSGIHRWRVPQPSISAAPQLDRWKVSARSVNSVGIPCFALGKADHAPAIYSSMAVPVVAQRSETAIAVVTNQ